MHELLPAAIFLLMVSVGMSLRLGEVFAHLGRLEWNGWLGLLTATFLIPPALALLLAEAFHLTPGEAAGLFMIGVAPGAPLLTRNMARKGFDMQIAASYQVWAAMMVPVMIPLVVAAAGKIYGRDIWIPPIVLLKQIALKELVAAGRGHGDRVDGARGIAAVFPGIERGGKCAAGGDDRADPFQNGCSVERGDAVGSCGGRAAGCGLDRGDPAGADPHRTRWADICDLQREPARGTGAFADGAIYPCKGWAADGGVLCDFGAGGDVRLR